MSTPNSPCAACKFLRRKCTQECVFAPYFPPDQPQKFSTVHRIYGASNVAKLLNELNTSQREDAVNSLAYEAEARLQDPVYGCVGLISILQHRLKEIQTDLYNAKKELAQQVGPQAMLPTLQSPPYMAAQAQAQQTHLCNSSSLIQHSGIPLMGVPTGQFLIRENQTHHQQQQQQQQHHQNVFEAQQLAAVFAARDQQEMLRVYEQQQQQQQEIVRFNRGFDSSDSINNTNSNSNNPIGFNQMNPVAVPVPAATAMSPSLALGTFDNSPYEQMDQHQHLQPQLFLQPQQQEHQSQQQRSNSDEGV